MSSKKACDMKNRQSVYAARSQNSFPCSVISIALRSARVIMSCIYFSSILPEISNPRKGHFEQK
jgi:hypothetical protein